ncbi:MAG: shikimate kinase [Pseudobdellovibrionaceae bacterium]
MLTCLIGHRGTGKTALLQRLRKYDSNAIFYDLDTEIEIQRGSIVSLFEKGESYFRQIEREVFESTLIKAKRFAEVSQVYFALGAGFPVDQIPEDVFCLWIRRETDKDGRIFLDRPRLNPDVPPLEESILRYEQRNPLFKKRANSAWTLPEGITENETEKRVFINQLSAVKGCLTLLPENMLTPEIFKRWWDTRNRWEVDYFEIRDDLLSQEQIELVLSQIPKKKIIYSFRSQKKSNFSIRELAGFGLYDWAMELGDCPYGVPPVLSLHERKGEIEDCINKLEIAGRGKSHLKLSVEIKSFEELRQGHLWGILRKENRSFLPRSPEGRFAWYRLLHKDVYKINFFREGEGSSADQPTLFQWLSGLDDPYRFAAVLGDPVDHSWTPVEQHDFFKARYVPIYAIQIKENEWKEAMPIIREMGLQFAAVTSPLKRQAFVLCGETSEKAKKVESVNTLYFDLHKSQWRGENTDIEGLFKYHDDVRNFTKIAVWGGGGTLGALKDTFPTARYYKGSNGDALDEKTPKATEFSPEVVVWGASRDENGHFFKPPEAWRPELVIDLNYRENSSGKEFALLKNASYISGEKMFKAQAEKQRETWEKCQ